MCDFFVAYLLFKQIVKEQPMRSYNDIFMECLKVVRNDYFIK